jgi:hypothetical protein
LMAIQINLNNKNTPSCMQNSRGFFMFMEMI